MSDYTLFFHEAQKADHYRVGGKCASLATMTQAGLPVPAGFAITTDAFAALLHVDGLGQRIAAEVEGLAANDLAADAAASERIRQMIEGVPMPVGVETAVRTAYATLCAQFGGQDLPVAVRSSATAEDLPNASFAGQQDTYLWIVGADELLTHVRKCWSSLYTPRAIAYRVDNQFAHHEVLMSVAVQKMVNARTSGVAMTLNPINGDRSKVVIDASWGLGEAVVSGIVTPDNFVVDKIVFEIVQRHIFPKQIELVADVAARRVVERHVEPERQTEPSLSPEEVVAVTKMAKQIERFYGGPQDIEWAIDADLPPSANLVVLQSRPETVWSQKTAVGPKTHQTGMAGILGTLLKPVKPDVGKENR